MHRTDRRWTGFPAFALPLGLLSAAAYLDAQFHIGYDLDLGYTAVKAGVASAWSEKRDRLNLFYILESYAKTGSTAKKTLLAYEGKTWTYREAYDISLQYGCWLRERHSVKPKEIVAMDLMNSPQFIFLWLGLWSIGAYPAFINHNLIGDPLMHCIKTSTARLLFVEESLGGVFTPEIREWAAASDSNQAPKPVDLVFLTHQIDLEIAVVKATRPPDDLRSGVLSHDMAALIYTSGTTGMPKAAIVSWGKIALGSRFVNGWYGMKCKDSFYTVSSPLPNHGSYLNGVVYAFIPHFCGSSWVLRYSCQWVHLHHRSYFQQSYILARCPYA